jgi:hypothetical protein
VGRGLQHSGIRCPGFQGTALKVGLLSGFGGWVGRGKVCNLCSGDGALQAEPGYCPVRQLCSSKVVIQGAFTKQTIASTINIIVCNMGVGGLALSPGEMACET